MKKYIAHEIKGGIFCRTIPVTVSRRLGGMPYAQAGWVDTVQKDGTTASDFYSYSSKIFTAFRAVVDGRQVVEGISTNDNDATSNCSRTTSRQVTLALRELGFSDAVAQAIKRYISSNPRGVVVKQYGRDWIDTATGEVVYAGGLSV